MRKIKIKLFLDVMFSKSIWNHNSYVLKKCLIISKTILNISIMVTCEKRPFTFLNRWELLIVSSFLAGVAGLHEVASSFLSLSAKLGGMDEPDMPFLCPMFDTGGILDPPLFYIWWKWHDNFKKLRHLYNYFFIQYQLALVEFTTSCVFFFYFWTLGVL